MIAQKIISLIFLTGGTAVSAHFVDAKNLLSKKIYESQNPTDILAGSISPSTQEKEKEIKEKITEFKNSMIKEDENIEKSTQKIENIFVRASRWPSKNITSEKSLIDAILDNNQKVKKLEIKIKNKKQEKTTFFKSLDNGWKNLYYTTKINLINKQITKQNSFKEELQKCKSELAKQQAQKNDLINGLIKQEDVLE